MSKTISAAKQSVSEQPLFKTPFSAGYWKAAAGEFKSLRTITVAALLIALRIAVASFYIPVGENLRIFFSFFVNSLGSIIYGPLMALLAGAIADLVGYVIAPSGAFFIGYTLTAMMGSFIYALFLYRAKITALRLTACKIAIAIVTNILMNSLWSQILYGKGYIYYLGKAIIKNIVLIPFEVWLLFLFLQIILPIAAKSGFIPREQGNSLTFAANSKKSGIATKIAFFAGISLIVIPIGVFGINAYKPLGIDMSYTGFLLGLAAIATAGIGLVVFAVAHNESMAVLNRISDGISNEKN